MNLAPRNEFLQTLSPPAAPETHGEIVLTSPGEKEHGSINGQKCVKSSRVPAPEQTNRLTAHDS